MSTFNILSVVTGVRYFSQNVNIIASFKFVKNFIVCKSVDIVSYVSFRGNPIRLLDIELWKFCIQSQNHTTTLETVWRIRKILMRIRPDPGKNDTDPDSTKKE